jgi:hypothetical protein
VRGAGTDHGGPGLTHREPGPDPQRGGRGQQAVHRHAHRVRAEARHLRVCGPAVSQGDLERTGMSRVFKHKIHRPLNPNGTKNLKLFYYSFKK